MSEPTDSAISDLSDEARQQWIIDNRGFGAHTAVVKAVWNECRRRAEAMLEQEKTHYRDNEIRWMNIVSKLKESLEQERRKAFEAGWRDREKQISGTYPIREMAYRAFQAQQEKP
jgi:hypothetical protein